MSKYDDFVDSVVEGAKALAKEQFKDYEETAGDDAELFLKQMKDDLARWTKLLASKDLTQEDFSDLVQAKRDLAKLHALAQKGIILTKLERFRAKFIDLVVDSAFGIFS